ncbi:MAG: Bax inhibitor-1 family protein [Verrucomicrobiae bacterium]|nr:Bax inhibitor-1 family protein [Verrucomicrobiae bacterium]
MSNPHIQNISVAEADPRSRAAFIRRTFVHLGISILLFGLLEAYLVNSPVSAALMNALSGSSYSWLVVLVLFMGVSWLANWLARSDFPQEIQYVGLGLFIVAEAFVFLPLLYMAAHYSSPLVIPVAGALTGVFVAALIAVAFITRKDFSFLGTGLTIFSFVALGVIVASIFLGFQLGIWFAALMVLFAGGCVLYDLSNIIHHYRTDQHVAASLALFASIAILFYYILRIVMSLMGGRRD